jgi:hypothetical protein
MAISSSGWSTGSAGLGDRFGAYVAAGNLPFVVLFGEHGADEADDRAAVGEDADDVAAAADLLVEPLERVVISYQRRSMPAVTLDRLNAGRVRVGEYGATVRDEGVRELGRAAPFLLDGLRAHVGYLAALRLARLRSERGSVGVVCPPLAPT